MKVYEALPPASVRLGFYRAAAPWKDVAVVEFGPEGTMHYVQSNVRGESSHFFATGLKEGQIIFGDTENLEKAILEIDGQLHPGLIIVMSSPVSEIIGADLRAVCFKMQPNVCAHLIAWDPIPVVGNETQGKTIAYEKAAAYLKKIDSTLPMVEKNGVLVLGLSEVDYNGISDLNEIRRMLMDWFGLKLLNDAFGRYALSDAKRAQFVWVIDQESLPLASAIKELWGTPWHHSVPYGFSVCRELVPIIEQAVGIAHQGQWEKDMQEAELILRQFRTGLESRRKRRIFLDIRPARMKSLETFLTMELGIEVYCPSAQVSALSTDGAVMKHSEIDKDDILLASGLLCALHPENDALCIDDPIVRHKTFSHHLPLIGLRGAENFLTLLYPFFL